MPHNIPKDDLICTAALA